MFNRAYESPYQNSIFHVACCALALWAPQLFRGWDEEKTVGRINNTIYEIAREYSIKLIDFHSAFKTFNEEGLFSDGIHPNRRGAEFMAKIL